ncbi:MAG: DUF1801 domain-containing protein [Paucibacter sp.]|nr:DUF1801 domain-containing protein [Roseateles sp.]
MQDAVIETAIESFIAKYTPEIAAELRAARRRLRAHFTHGHELVFDNYNALVFGISPSERSRESFISIAGYPKWITLFFLDGAALADPAGLLEGDGKQVRGVRLRSAAQLDEPEVQALIAQAIAPHREALAQAPRLGTTIKQVADKQRPRRPADKPAKTARRA